METEQTETRIPVWATVGSLILILVAAFGWVASRIVTAVDEDRTRRIDWHLKNAYDDGVRDERVRWIEREQNRLRERSK